MGSERIDRFPEHDGAALFAGAEPAQCIHAGVPRPTLSPLVPAFILRLFDISAIGLPGLLAYLAYVYPSESSLNGRYIGTVLLAAAAGSVLLQWTGV